ncbi:PEGA domain-containing protein [Treponema sp. OMZ 799]|uniref:PEGA domain-containing protein n=1 Tax=Treponema sp. OMZ 799 TaxID=2563668 RepID=UPI0020A5630D|nr:PEGA domain-containing protein [Treponema sp. OMZ 799]UTC78406.1 PEGA domain-containing protein [Treponema sp. OMZ 799]
MSSSFKLKKLIFLSAFFFIVSFLFAQKTEDENSDWTIAVSEFKTEGLPSSYQSYKTIVPQMFLIYMDTGSKRIVPFEEKKMRALMEASNKKLKLIKERAKLIKDRDELFLSVEDKKVKDEKEKKLTEEILKKEKGIYDAGIDIKIEENRFFTSGQPKNISLWKYGETLYKMSENADLGESLKKENISALIYGSVKDISGYMVITAYLDTGLSGMKVHEFSGAGRYDDVEKVVEMLVRQIYTIIQNTKEVKVFFEVNPKNAKVYIDGKLIRDFSKPITLREGFYQIGASAQDYVEEAKKIELKNKDAYTLKINLKKEKTETIGFNLKSGSPNLFFKSQYSIRIPGIITIPKMKSIFEFEEKGVHTFGVLEPSNNSFSRQNVQNMIIKLNKKNVKDSIETQRKILYWSLGALYISLPITMILKSRVDDEVYAFKSGKVPYQQSKVERINRLGMTQNVFQGITIALGVNYFIQLIIYLVKADRALPRKIKPNYSDPVYEETALDKPAGDQSIADKPIIKDEENKNEE